MPNRVIRESITSSPTLDQLSPEAERLFYRLIVKADDFGRFEAEPRVLLARCFELKVGSWRPDTVGRWYGELEAAGLCRSYTVRGRRYGVFLTADRHFTKRAKESKYPAPERDDVGCSQMRADASDRAPPLEHVPEERGTRNEERGTRQHRERGSRVPDPFVVDDTLRAFAWALGFRGRLLETTVAEFVDYWRGVPGAKGRKLDWPGTFRNRLRDLVARRDFTPMIATEPYYAETDTGVVMLDVDDPRHPGNGGAVSDP